MRIKLILFIIICFAVDLSAQKIERLRPADGKDYVGVTGIDSIQHYQQAYLYWRDSLGFVTDSMLIDSIALYKDTDVDSLAYRGDTLFIYEDGLIDWVIIDIPDGGSDDQLLTIVDHTLSIEGGNSIIIPDSIGSDDQKIDQFDITGNTLNLSLEDDGQTPKNVSLLPYLDDTVLTEAQVDNYVNNNGYLLTEVDGSITNEIQTIGQNTTTRTIFLSGSNTIDISEAIQDEIGTMLSGNTETGITVTYDDPSNEIDFIATGTNQVLGQNTTTRELSLTPGNTIDISEAIQDEIGTMLSGNTETGITVNYDDANNEIDFIATGINQVLGQNTTTRELSLTPGNTIDISEAIQDEIGTMLSGNTETGIAVTYDDASNEIDFIVSGGGDDDWYQAGTTTPPTSQTQNITRTGNVSIGSTLGYSNPFAVTATTSTTTPMMQLDQKGTGYNSLFFNRTGSSGDYSFGSNSSNNFIFSNSGSLGVSPIFTVSSNQLDFNRNIKLPASVSDDNGTFGNNEKVLTGDTSSGKVEWKYKGAISKYDQVNTTNFTLNYDHSNVALFAGSSNIFTPNTTPPTGGTGSWIIYNTAAAQSRTLQNATSGYTMKTASNGTTVTTYTIGPNEAIRVVQFINAYLIFD